MSIQKNKYFSNLTVTDNIRVGTQVSFGNNKAAIDISGNDLILSDGNVTKYLKNMVTSGLQSNLTIDSLILSGKTTMNSNTGFPVTCDISGNSVINNVYERIKVTIANNSGYQYLFNGENLKLHGIDLIRGKTYVFDLTDITLDSLTFPFYITLNESEYNNNPSALFKNSNNLNYVYGQGSSHITTNKYVYLRIPYDTPNNLYISSSYGTNVGCKINILGNFLSDYNNETSIKLLDSDSIEFNTKNGGIFHMDKFGNIGINNNSPSENYKLDISGSVICGGLKLMNDFTLKSNRSIKFADTDCYIHILNNQLQFVDSKTKLTLSDITRLKTTTTTVFNRNDYLNIDLYKKGLQIGLPGSSLATMQIDNDFGIDGIIPINYWSMDEGTNIFVVDQVSEDIGEINGAINLINMWGGEKRNGSMLTLKFLYPEYVRIELRRNATNQLLNNWLTITDRFTITTWFRTDLFTGNGNILDFKSDGITLGINNNSIFLIVKDQNGQNYHARNLSESEKTNLNNTWTMVGVSWNNTSHKICFYIKNDLVDIYSEFDNILDVDVLWNQYSNFGYARIGYNFIGSLSNLKLYDQELSQSQFDKLYTFETRNGDNAKQIALGKHGNSGTIYNGISYNYNKDTDRGAVNINCAENVNYDYPLRVNSFQNKTDSVNYYYDNSGIDISGNIDFKKVSIFAENYVLAEGFAVSSDERIKDNIRDIDIKNFIDKVEQLNIQNYEFIDKDKYGYHTSYGLIAQQVEKIFPEAIVTKTEYIPCIFNKFMKIRNGNIMTIRTNIIDVVPGENIVFFSPSGNYVIGKIIEYNGILTKVQFETEELAKEFDLLPYIFIYGKQVDNFKMIKKGYLTNLSIGTCKYLIEENKELNNRLQKIEDQIKFVEMNQGLNDTIVKLSEEIDYIKKRLHI